MEATPTLIIKYFSGFMQNLVPLFQRPYTWSEKQWKTLWDDIVSFYYVDIPAKKASHFLGAVVTMPARSVPIGISKFLVIDGQQRLTTIALLMCAIRDPCFPTRDCVKRCWIESPTAPTSSRPALNRSGSKERWKGEKGNNTSCGRLAIDTAAMKSNQLPSETNSFTSKEAEIRNFKASEAN